MLVKCPACGSRNSLDVLLNDDDATKAVLAAMRFSTVGKLMIRYLTLFRPEKSGLTMKRLAKLLEELQPMIDAQRIKFDGVDYHAPLLVWEIALEKVIQQRDAGKLQTPMDNHNYPFKVIVTEISKREADRVARGEAKKQQEQQAGEKQLADAQQKLDQRDETPQRQPRQPMPDNIKKLFRSVLNTEAAMELTPEEKEQRKKQMLDDIKSRLPDEQKQQPET